MSQKDHIELLKNQFDLSEAQVDLFFSVFKVKKFNKKEAFVKEGELCNYVGFLLKGMMICVYQREGEEVIEEFAEENSFVANYYSFLTGTKSEKEIRCIEECEVLIAHKSAIDALAKEHPFLEKMARINAENLFIQNHNRVKSLLLENASERYIRLKENRKELEQRVPQYLIAAHLRIKPETLSRIRKSIY